MISSSLKWLGSRYLSFEQLLLPICFLKQFRVCSGNVGKLYYSSNLLEKIFLRYKKLLNLPQVITY